jgi:hypothetical protein
MRCASVSACTGHGNLTLERVYLQELLSFSPDSLLLYPAARRMAQSWFDSGSFDLAIRQVEQMPKPSTQLSARAVEQVRVSFRRSWPTHI